ncbi:hypothetical protein R3W88_011705 [Solanum pinnatisectum]|uniref:TF-B3 domain-containing protein n=1 Tax=Solanum pinnatisectum TaxID=50273 RepID=A0AAV9L888_9SOLN|nr:hypothetical protein R3W88_011705 [Solanum pinnatisectum]
MCHQVSPPSSTTSTCTIVDFSSIDSGKDDPNSPFFTLFTQVSKNTSNPQFLCFCFIKSRELGEEKFVPLKKIKLRNESNGEEGHWITKRLTRSDVNGASRLLLSQQDVNNYILPFMNEEKHSIIYQQLYEVDVTIFDMDTQTSHILTLKKWSTNSFHLVKAWTKDFVKRKNLKENDEISICWEKTNYRFCFRVDTRNQLDL